MFLRLDQLVKTFPARGRSGEVTAVDRVSIDIDKGRFVTLLGPSGCGKTTTLRLIAGFEFPTSGTITLDGQVINEVPPNRRDMAMVFQSYAIFPHLNVFDNIAYGLNVKRLSQNEIRRQVGEVMQLTELTGLENRQPNQLSGGQQQRVALARALVMHPKVLLFDEPLSNLDAKLRVQMRSEIRRIQQELGITSVYVTHDQDEAMVLSDLIVVMHQGRVQQAASAVEIYRRPVNRFVADFIGRANFLPVQVVAKEGKGWRVHVQGIELSVPAAAQELRVDAPALLLVRPESLRVHAAPVADRPSLAGRVIRTSYLGSHVEYEVAVGDMILSATGYDPGSEELYPEGTDVYVEFVGENLYLLPSS